MSLIQRQSMATPSLTSISKPRVSVAVGWFVGLATALPLVVAYQQPPQPAFFNQWLSALLWGFVAAVFIVTSAAATSFRDWFSDSSLRAARPMLVALLILILAIILHAVVGVTPWFVALPALCVLTLGCVLSVTTARLGFLERRMLFRYFSMGIVIAAVANAVVALVQWNAPSFGNELFVAQLQGDRVFGNLRQPNLLALVCVWGICAIWEALDGWRSLNWVVCALLFWAVFASGSRAGMIALVIAVAIIIAGLLWSRQIAARTRGAATQQARKKHSGGYWWFIGACVALVGVALLVGGYLWEYDTRVTSTEQRVLLWKNVLGLIKAEPWTGVGFGQLNFAWTLTPFAQRSPDVFDHAHNLILQLVVELGAPIATAVLFFLLIALLRALKTGLKFWQWTIVAFIAAVLVQSLFEYPLWFAHFLLPTVFAAALLCGASTEEESTDRATLSIRTTRTKMVIAGLTGAASVAIASWFIYGYLQVAAIYNQRERLDLALQAAQRAKTHTVYGHYGDYALIMLDPDRAELSLFARPTRSLIDERLLAQWARSYDRAGDVARASHLASRAFEFPAAQAFGGLPPVENSKTPNASLRRELAASDFREQTRKR